MKLITGTMTFFATLTPPGLMLAMGFLTMGLADNIVNMAIGNTLAAVAVAAASTFGLEGRNVAEKYRRQLCIKNRLTIYQQPFSTTEQEL